MTTSKIYISSDFRGSKFQNFTEHIVNPRTSTWHIISKNELLLGCLFEGGAYFQVWNFPDRLTEENYNFLSQQS